MCIHKASAHDNGSKLYVLYILHFKKRPSIVHITDSLQNISQIKDSTGTHDIVYSVSYQC